MDGTRLERSDPLVGQVLGERYRVLARIGAGGMGTVYRAEHVVLGKRVAVKVLRPELSQDEDLVRRFQHEAIAASQIGQENIVDVTDFGRTPHGSLYFAMEELQGVSLAVLLQDGPLAVDRATVILLQTSRALGAAHERGIVHRDLKPDNVIVVRRGDGSEQVKVVDFGIAKSRALPEGERVTRAGMIIGTPEYMAPEQGAAATVDHRADVYAFGVLAYELLTGRVPFRGETAVATVLQHQTRMPVRPSQLRPETPPALEKLILNALAKRPAARPQTMAEISAELSRILAETDTPPPHVGHSAPGAAAKPLPDPGATARWDGSDGSYSTATTITGTRRGATVEMEMPRRARRTAPHASRDAPRRGRKVAVIVVLLAMVVASVAAMTWWSTASPRRTPAAVSRRGPKPLPPR